MSWEVPPAALAQLLRLASPALPVGGYSYSQGLEWAITSGKVADEKSAADWIIDALSRVLGGFEAPLWWRMYQAWAAWDGPLAARLNQWFLATRETRELRAETVQMGFSLFCLLESSGEIHPEDLDPLRRMDEPAYPTAFSFAAAFHRIPGAPALAGYLWSWAENQVLAAVKAIPLGQVAGQRILLRVAEHIPEVVDRAASLPDDALSSHAPALAIASSRHETQYSRLFRS